MGDTLSKVLALLGNSVDETQITSIIDLVKAQLTVRINEEAVPDNLDYIIVNVSVARYNQIGDEGKSSMTVEGESAAWLTDLFTPYEKDIQSYLDNRDKASNGVRVRFL